MIKKTENCLYCGIKMESKTAKKKFCSELCRVYNYREVKRGTLPLPKIERTIAESKVADSHQYGNSLTLIPDFESEKLTDFEIKQIEERIAVLEKEIKNPSNSMIPKKVYISVRQSEITELQSKLK